MHGDRTLYLAAGMQSGGTSLVSWCFLQRADMDGVLDLPHDTLMPVPEVNSRYAWAKGTIASFTFDEIADYYRWQGWQVRPLLIVRDVRDVYSSLQHKWYGQNGTTAGDPPLRTRLSRFHATWHSFVERDWPILCYERLVLDAEAELRDVCGKMGLDWDPAILTWPKAPHEIAAAEGGNKTLLDTRGHKGLEQALIRPVAKRQWGDVAASEMDWMGQHFADMIEAFDYPPFTDPSHGQDETAALPTFEVTRRHALECRLRQLEGCHAGLLRLKNHPVIGPLIRIWARVFNPGLNEVFDDVASSGR